MKLQLKQLNSYLGLFLLHTGSWRLPERAQHNSKATTPKYQHTQLTG